MDLAERAEPAEVYQTERSGPGQLIQCLVSTLGYATSISSAPSDAASDSPAYCHRRVASIVTWLKGGCQKKHRGSRPMPDCTGLDQGSAKLEWARMTFHPSWNFSKSIVVLPTTRTFEFG